MQISISNQSLKAYLLDSHKAVWKLHIRSKMLAVGYFILLGICFIVFALRPKLAFTTEAVTDATNGQVGLLYGVNFSLTIGVAFLLVALYLALVYFVGEKVAFQRAINMKVQRINAEEDRYSMTITDDMVIYEDAELRREEKKRRFIGYKVSKGYVFLMATQLLTGSVAIDTTKLTSDERGMLTRWLNSGLTKL